MVATASDKDGRARLMAVQHFNGHTFEVVTPTRQAKPTGDAAQVRSLASDLRARMVERTRQDAAYAGARPIVLTE